METFGKLVEFLKANPRYNDVQYHYIDCILAACEKYTILHCPDGQNFLVAIDFNTKVGASFMSGYLNKWVIVVEASEDGKEIWVDYK